METTSNSIKRNRRWDDKKGATPEYNSGEVIVKDNVSIKLKELMSNWTSKPGLISGLTRAGIGFDESTLDIEHATVLPMSTDITDIEAQVNMIGKKRTKAIEKAVADKKAADQLAAEKAEAEKKQLIIDEYERGKNK